MRRTFSRLALGEIGHHVISLGAEASVHGVVFTAGLFDGKGRAEMAASDKAADTVTILVRLLIRANMV